MNNAAVNAEEVPLPSWSGSLCSFALKVLDELKRDNWELSFLLCGNKTITALNAQYRNKAEPTDILSFSMGDGIPAAMEQQGDSTVYLPGDIVISLETLFENARYFEIPEDEELRRLIIHGILHLDGMDHETSDIDEPMLILQEEILNRLKDYHIISAVQQDEGSGGQQ
ncbi:MAG: rRNA maturation RNase YbeY [Treponema sp.]|nr:rRNA maturation RNase YbeY [Treponema sp.]